MDDKSTKLAAALTQMDKQFGKGTVMLLGSNTTMDVETISTGIVGIDHILGGGFPKGRIVEIYGQPASGKTSLTLHLIAEVQKQGGIAAFIDAEHALDPAYARNLGVDTANLVISQPDYGEQALEVALALVNAEVDIIVVDSVAALVPKAELEGEIGQSFMGSQARMMSQALRKLTAAVSNANACLIFINQTREKIGIVFGDPTVTSGGNALKFYSSARVEVRRSTALKDGETTIGNRTKIKVIKNKIAPPFKEVEVDILYGKGISRHGDILDMAVDHGVVEKSGSWYNFKTERIGQGRDNVRDKLVEDGELCSRIESDLRVVLKA